MHAHTQCNGNDIITPDAWSIRNFQTPLPGQPDYQPSYQSYGTLQGHVRLIYAPDRNSANLTVVVVQKTQAALTFYLGGTAFSSPSQTFCQSGCANTWVGKPLSVKITGSDGSSLTLDAVDFYWNIPNRAINRTGDFRNGQKGAIVEMFGWPHKEIAAECTLLSKAGYLGVKVYPVSEHVMADLPFSDILNPWYFYYQPVSYRLQGRMGTRDDLRNMISTCRQLGVRVYADAVVNHMVGSGSDTNTHHRNPNAGCVNWGAKNSSAADTSPYYTQGFVYTNNTATGLAWTQEFPAVPYGPTDFHCERALNSWTDPLDLNAGWLSGLVDLNTEKDNVQQRIADYMTDLLSIGFSGFRVDAGKHIRPEDHAGIFSKLKANLGGSFPDDFITWLEVLLGGEANMLLCNPNSGYSYSAGLVGNLSAAGLTASEIDKIKIWYSAYPKETDVDCGELSRTRMVVQNDDSDQQTSGSTSRDMGDQGSVLIRDKNVPVHRSFEVKLFTNPNGITDNDNLYPIRNVLSSYWIDLSLPAYGVPDGLSDCSLCRDGNCQGTCYSMPYTKAQNDSSCGYDMQVYTRVHRDRSIIMAMRSWMHLPTSVPNSEIGLPDGCQ